jgi:uncharacterized membrane protein
MELLVSAANLLFVASYFVSDLLKLRLLTVTASACLASYFAALPQPLPSVVAWNIFFVALNVLQILRLLRARRAPGRLGTA